MKAKTPRDSGGEAEALAEQHWCPHPVFLVVPVAALSWYLTILGEEPPLGPIGILTWLPSCVLAAGLLSRSRAWAAATILSIPLVVGLAATIGGAINGYVTGDPYLISGGPDLLRTSGIDRATRLRYRSIRGCFRSEPWETYDRIHDGLTRALVHVFGNAAGAYTGPYPTPAEAYAAIEASTERIPRKAVLTGDFVAAGKRRVLDPEIVFALEREYTMTNRGPDELLVGTTPAGNLVLSPVYTDIEIPLWTFDESGRFFLRIHSYPPSEAFKAARLAEIRAWFRLDRAARDPVESAPAPPP